jgi:hypothetical protein
MTRCVGIRLCHYCGGIIAAYTTHVCKDERRKKALHNLKDALKNYNPSVDSSNSGRSEAEAERTARMPRPSRMAGLEGDGASAKGEERSPEVASGGIPTTVKAGCKGADGKPKRSRKRPVTLVGGRNP